MQQATINRIIRAYCDIFQCHQSECAEFKKFLTKLERQPSPQDIDDWEDEETISAGEADAIRWAVIN